MPKLSVAIGRTSAGRLSRARVRRRHEIAVRRFRDAEEEADQILLIAIALAKREHVADRLASVLLGEESLVARRDARPDLRQPRLGGGQSVGRDRRALVADLDLHRPARRRRPCCRRAAAGPQATEGLLERRERAAGSHDVQLVGHRRAATGVLDGLVQPARHELHPPSVLGVVPRVAIGRIGTRNPRRLVGQLVVVAHVAVEAVDVDHLLGVRGEDGIARPRVPHAVGELARQRVAVRWRGDARTGVRARVEIGLGEVQPQSHERRRPDRRVGAEQLDCRRPDDARKPRPTRGGRAAATAGEDADPRLSGPVLPAAVRQLVVADERLPGAERIVVRVAREVSERARDLLRIVIGLLGHPGRPGEDGPLAAPNL